MEKRLEIQVFGSRRYDSCSGGGWGPSQSQEEITEIFSEIITKSYGSQVFMKYIDIDDKETMDKFPEVVEILQRKALTSLPLIAFDGTPLWLGSLSYYYLTDELKKRGVKPVA